MAKAPKHRATSSKHTAPPLAKQTSKERKNRQKRQKSHGQPTVPPVSPLRCEAVCTHFSRTQRGHLACPSPPPQPVTKITSLRGKHELGLHAAGAFQTSAPSPSLLPAPPSRWKQQSQQQSQQQEAGPASSSAPAPPAPARSASALKDLQGNLLYACISPAYPELAGKLVGMLLELEADEVAVLLADSTRRDASVREALDVLVEAGDPRALAAARAAPEGAPPQRRALTVEVAPPVRPPVVRRGSSASSQSTGLTPSLPEGLSLRMSPRPSMYGTRTLLGLPAGASA